MTPRPQMYVCVCAMQGCTLRRATFSASALSTGLDYGASYGCASDDPALIVTRATEAAKFGEGASGWSGYSLLTNNCETFAYWCSTGRRVLRNKSCCVFFSRKIVLGLCWAFSGGCTYFFLHMQVRGFRKMVLDGRRESRRNLGCWLAPPLPPAKRAWSTKLIIFSGVESPTRRQGGNRITCVNVCCEAIT